ncbi:MAG: FAD-dependent oxidoreductase, partial [Kiloniellales bacterium]
MKTHARVVIVGGGMMGVGLLYHLAKEGWSDCVLVEKGEITSGSTWHAAGQCPSFVGSLNLAKIHHYGNTLYPRLEAETGQYVGWHGCGGIRFANTPEEVDYFRYVQGFARNVGFEMEIIGPNEIRNINPFVDVSGVIAGAYTSMDGHVDPAGCCNAMAAGARQLGATIYRRNRVLDIKPARGNGDAHWDVITEQGTISAEHVVNAAGCYADQVGAWVGLNVPFANMKHHYLVTEPIPEFQARDVEMPVMRDPYCSAYYRQEQKAGLIGIYETSGSREAWDGKGPAWESESELFEAELDSILPWVERVLERMPIWREAGIRRIVHGAIPHTPDSNPLLGPAPGLTNFWLCCGSSIGIAQGGGCGKYLAQWMVHGDADINMLEFDPRRYGNFATADYTRAKSFQDYEHMYALHAPGEERPAGRPARTSSLYEKLLAKGAVFTEACGWERPKWFAPKGVEEDIGFRRGNAFNAVAAECRAVRERVGLLDLSSFAKFDVTGRDAAALLERLLANRLPQRDGGMALAHLLNDNGRIQGEVTVTRLGPDRFYLLSGAVAELRERDRLVQGIHEGEDIHVTNLTDDFGVLVLSGPRSREVLGALTEAPLTSDAFPWLTGKEITVAGVGLRALRVSYAGELGWELHAPMADLPALYDALMQAGKPHGIADFGVYALNSLRLEKAYKGWGSELTNEITMIEAGMERFVRTDKGDFIGRAATQQRKADGVNLTCVYVEVDAADADARGNEPVLDGERTIGIVSSGGYGHAIGKSLAARWSTRPLNEPFLAIPGSWWSRPSRSPRPPP